MFDMVAQSSCWQTSGSIHTPELAHSAGVLGHVQLSVADQLVREVVAVSHSVTAGSDSDALVRVGAPELLGGASGLDVGRRQFAVEFVTTIETVHVRVTHLVPSEAP